jgi:N-succinyldiaminopimelate aminotransferase
LPLDAIDWSGVQLAYTCSPVIRPAACSLAEWRALFELSDRHGFIIASDECYSEIYCDERSRRWARWMPRAARPRRFPRLGVFQPLQALECARHALGLRRGRRAVLKQFLLYRTYHGSAMSTRVQRASIAAWNDEAHVRENRRSYAAKYAAVLPCCGPAEDGRCRTAASTCGSARPSTMASSPAACSNNIMCWSCRQFPCARSAAGEPGRNHVRVALVRQPTNASKRRSA